MSPCSFFREEQDVLYSIWFFGHQTSLTILRVIVASMHRSYKCIFIIGRPRYFMVDGNILLSISNISTSTINLLYFFGRDVSIFLNSPQVDFFKSKRSFCIKGCCRLGRCVRRRNSLVCRSWLQPIWNESLCYFPSTKLIVHKQ